MIMMMGFNCGELMLFYIIAYIFILKSSSINNKFTIALGLYLLTKSFRALLVCPKNWILCSEYAGQDNKK